MDEIFDSLKNFKFTFDKTQKNVVQRFYVKNHTEETKKQISDMKKGKKLTAEHIEKVRQSRVGKKQPESQKQKVREFFQKEWLVTSPEGKQSKIINLRKFCLEHSLDQGNMVKVSKGILKQHKGWKCYSIS